MRADCCRTSIKECSRTWGCYEERYRLTGRIARPLAAGLGGSRRDQDHPVRSNAEAQRPASAAQPTHRCPSPDAWLHPAEGTQRSEARPVPMRHPDPRRSPRSLSFRSFARRRSRRRAWSGVSEHRSAASVRVIWPWASTYCRTICFCYTGPNRCIERSRSRLLLVRGRHHGDSLGSQGSPAR